MEWLDSHGYHLKVQRIGVPDTFVDQGSVDQLYKLCSMDAESIFNAIKHSK